MKAIYINLDPYVRAARAYVAGETDTPPRIVPLALPLSVVVPAGEDAALLCQTEATAASGTQPLPFATWSVSPSLGDPVRTGLSLHLSEEFVAETAAAYAIPQGAASVVATVTLTDGDAEDPRTVELPPITVLVRRERAQGPVDLVDMQAPPDMAGVDLAGATFGGSAIVADETTGALSAPAAEAAGE